MRAKETDAILYDKKLISEDPQQITRAQYNPFANIIVTIAGSTLHFYTSKNSLEKSDYKKHGMDCVSVLNHPCDVVKLLFLDAKQFVTAGADGIARVYSLETQ